MGGGREREGVSFVEGVELNFKLANVISTQQVPKVAAKKKFATKMRSIVSAVKVAQRLEVGTFKS